MQEGVLEKRGIYYRLGEFNPERLTIVLVHGLSGNSSAWRPFESHFRATHNLLVLDLRGHGKSKKYRRYRDYNLAEFAEDMDSLLTELDIHKFTLLTHSFGTLVALEYLLKYHHKVHSNIFVSAAHGIHRTKRARATLPFVTATAWLADLVPFEPKYGTEMDNVRYLNTGDWNIPRMYKCIASTSLRVYMHCLKHAYKFNRDSWWGQVKTPTLIVHGEKDSIVPVKEAFDMASKITGSKLAIIKGANHTLPLNEKYLLELVSQVREFVAQ